MADTFCNCDSNIKLDDLKRQYFIDKILIVVQKNCGYQLLVPIQNNGSINDMYKYIDLYYNHVEPSLNLYFINNNSKKFIQRCNTPIKQFINIHNIRPCTSMPSPVIYKFILDLC